MGSGVLQAPLRLRTGLALPEGRVRASYSTHAHVGFGVGQLLHVAREEGGANAEAEGKRNMQLHSPEARKECRWRGLKEEASSKGGAGGKRRPQLERLYGRGVCKSRGHSKEETIGEEETRGHRKWIHWGEEDSTNEQAKGKRTRSSTGRREVRSEDGRRGAGPRPLSHV